MDLLAVAAMVHRQQGVVRLVAGAAQGVGDDEDPVAEVDGAQYAREHADLGLAAGHHQGVDAAGLQAGIEVGAEPGRVDGLVEDLRRRREAGEAGGEVDEAGRQAVPGHRRPASRVAGPGAASLAGMLGGDEAGEDGARRMRRHQALHPRQHPGHPGRVPVGLLQEQALHVDAQVQAVRSQRPGARTPLAHGSLPRSAEAGCCDRIMADPPATTVARAGSSVKRCRGRRLEAPITERNCIREKTEHAVDLSVLGVSGGQCLRMHVHRTAVVTTRGLFLFEHNEISACYTMISACNIR